MRSFARAVRLPVGVRGAATLGSLLPEGPDPKGLREFSVVYTDRAVNHMSKNFQATMNGISSTFKKVYNHDATIVIPGSGTYAMEAVARQFATGKKVMVIRNGWFSYRWTQIFEAAGICKDHSVLKGKFAGGSESTFAPVPIDEAVAAIKAEKPQVVFAPHVETSAGVILPDEYIKQLADAVHSVGGMMVLDGIASGTVWVDCNSLGVDAFITAPQKGWSGPSCAGLVTLSKRGVEELANTTSTSFTIDLKKWHQVMQTYENGAHMYHATMPTDALTTFHNIIQETEAYGFDKLKKAQIELGSKAVDLLESKGVKVLAAPGFRAPGVIVSYTKDSEIQTGKKFIANGVQIAGGVPLQCDEPADFKTFRLGLFGLDKLKNVDATIADLDKALSAAL